MGHSDRAFDAGGRGLPKLLSAIGSAIVFFAVLTPIAVLLRVAGKDPLRRRRAELPTYWLPRRTGDGRHTPMTRQF